MKSILLRLPNDLKELVESYSSVLWISMNELCTQSIIEFLQKHQEHYKQKASTSYEKVDLYMSFYWNVKNKGHTETTATW